MAFRFRWPGGARNYGNYCHCDCPPTCPCGDGTITLPMTYQVDLTVVGIPAGATCPDCSQMGGTFLFSVPSPGCATGVLTKTVCGATLHYSITIGNFSPTQAVVQVYVIYPPAGPGGLPMFYFVQYFPRPFDCSTLNANIPLGPLSPSQTWTSLYIAGCDSPDGHEGPGMTCHVKAVAE